MDDYRIDLDKLFGAPAPDRERVAPAPAPFYRPESGRVISRQDPVGDFLRRIEQGVEMERVVSLIFFAWCSPVIC